MMKILKKSLIVFALLVLCAATLGACDCNKNTNPSETEESIALTLNFYVLDIRVGVTARIIATVKGSDEQIQWSSSDESVATVASGSVYGVSVGTSIISAKVGDKTATCKVNVTGEESTSLQSVPILKLTLSTDCIWVGYEFAPNVSLTFEGKEIISDIILSSANDSVAKIENGKIVGVGVGNTVIMATCTYHGEIYQDSVNIRVEAELIDN